MNFTVRCRIPLEPYLLARPRSPRLRLRDQRLARVLWNDPATGVMRHADAGYESAIECAGRLGLDLPSIGD